MYYVYHISVQSSFLVQCFSISLFLQCSAALYSSEISSLCVQCFYILFLIVLFRARSLPHISAIIILTSCDLFIWYFKYFGIMVLHRIPYHGTFEYIFIMACLVFLDMYLWVLCTVYFIKIRTIISTYRSIILYYIRFILISVSVLS